MAATSSAIYQLATAPAGKGVVTSTSFSQVPVVGTIGFGNTVVVEVPTDAGDVLTGLALQLDMPELVPKSSNHVVEYADLHERLINNVTVYFGGNKMYSLDRDTIGFLNKLDIWDADPRNNYYRNQGAYQGSLEFISLNQLIPSKVPLVAIQHTNLRVEIEFSTLDQVFIIGDTETGELVTPCVSLLELTAPMSGYSVALYDFLDTDTRKKLLLLLINYHLMPLHHLMNQSVML